MLATCRLERHPVRSRTACVHSILINLYWVLGERIALKSDTSAWPGPVAALSAYIQERHQGLRVCTLFAPAPRADASVLREAYRDEPQFGTLPLSICAHCSATGTCKAHLVRGADTELAARPPPSGRHRTQGEGML